MTDLTIKPTHTCFDDTESIVVAHLREDPKCWDRLKVVHAICIMPDTGKPYAHAWVEDGDEVLFMGVYKDDRVIAVVDKTEFYAEMKVQRPTYYTIPQVVEHGVKQNRSGPWKQEYMELCRDYHPSKAIQP
jgi:hypothetical protein